MAKPIPDGYHSVTPYLAVSNAGEALAWYKQALGATEVMRFEHGGKVGLPDISVESDFDRATDQQGTSLVLGKYLSPRLYVSWGVSLTESINTFKMRYTINDRWTVKTEAGKEGSADLVYTIEK